MPKVSALLPTYNTKPEYLRECIDSVLAQTFTDFELIIVDDCSSDPSVKETILSYDDKRIRFYENEKNLGISGARNRLIELAQGEYLAVVDHDDISLPKRFELQVKFLDEHPEVGVVGAAIEEFPAKGKSSLPQNNDDIENLMMLEIAVDHQVSMLRKEILVKNKLHYEQEFSPSEDYRLWVCLIGKTKFANLPDTLLHYRVHGKNTSRVEQHKNLEKQFILTELAKREHPEIWDRAKRAMIHKNKYKLFGFLNLMTVKIINKQTDYLLLGFIPILKKYYKVRLVKK